MAAAAESLPKVKRNWDFLEKVIEAYAAPLTILPIAGCECPFWMNETAQLPTCLVRIRDRSEQDERPLHRALAFQLSTESFELLQGEVARLGKVRMQLDRVADVATVSDQLGRGHGVHFLVFRYGNWRHVQPAGLGFGGAGIPPGIEKDIGWRLDTDELAKFDQEVLSRLSQGAERIRSWIASIDEWRMDQYVVAIEPWAARITALADQVIANSHVRGDAKAAAAVALQFVFGSTELAEQVETHGLAAVFGDDPPRWQAGLRLFDKSARQPVIEVADGMFDPQLFSRRTYGVGFVSPARRSGP
jgi:hypothetical protein